MRTVNRELTPFQIAPDDLRAAKKANVKWYFVEDESPSVEQQIPVSLNYLKTVKF